MEYREESNNDLSKSQLKKIYFFIGLLIFIFILIITIIYLINNLPTSFDLYISSAKFLYVRYYIDGNNLINFLNDHNFSKIYFYVGNIQSHYSLLEKGEFFNHGNEKLSNLFDRIKAKYKEVVPFIYLNDDNDDFSNIENIPKVCAAFKDNFTTLLLDLEPTEALNFEKLLKTYKNCTQYINVSAILLSDWLNVKMKDLQSSFTDSDFYNQFQNCDTLIDAIMEVTNYTIFKAYSNQYEKIDALLEEFDNIRQKHSSNVATPILEMDPNDDENGLFPIYKKDKNEFFEYFVKVAETFNETGIHDYLVWYNDLYCQNLYYNLTYYNGTPIDCNKNE